jgi:hypothetical protein
MPVTHTEEVHVTNAHTRSPYRHARRALLALAAMASLALAMAPGTAHASASGCTQLGGWKTDAVCINVVGSGLNVKTARASISLPTGQACNTRLYITYYDTNNVKYDQRISSLQSGCTKNREWTQTYNKNMRAGRVCGAVSENGVLRPGACVSIFA